MGRNIHHFYSKNGEYFFIHQFKHMLWVPQNDPSFYWEHTPYVTKYTLLSGCLNAFESLMDTAITVSRIQL